MCIAGFLDAMDSWFETKASRSRDSSAVGMALI
jgi:hypothetical protein